jgi:uncharacterized membrane protein YbhN (UPF0104 family)
MAPHARRGIARRLRNVLPVAIVAAVVAGLVIGTGPAAFARAMTRFDVRLLVPILLASLLILVLQGIRWHYLLRELGVRLRVGETVLLSVAGQSITAILPLGDLTRAIFASEATDHDFGEIVATVTVQELTYTLLLVLSAVPGLLQFHLSIAIVVVTIAGELGVLAILTVPPLFHLVHALVARTPFLRRYTSEIDQLQHETVVLLHRPATLASSILDLARVAVAVTVFWLVVRGLTPAGVGWLQAALVLAVSYVGGAISLIPGGAGATEATTVGALILLGVEPGTATAAALIQRVLVPGISTVAGFIAYAIARRRYHVSGLRALRPPPRQAQQAAS